MGEDLKNAGCYSLFLEVCENNDPAIAVYQQAGFQNIGKRKGYYRDKNSRSLDAILMKKPLR